jgi:hypothetical protein
MLHLLPFFFCSAALGASCGTPQPGLVLGTGGTKSTASSLDECCSRCLKDPECGAYTWDGSKEKTCYVKDNAVGSEPCKSDHPACVSALRGSPSPTPPTPTPPGPSPGAPPNGQGCLSPAARALPYCNSSLSIAARVDDLAGRLSIDNLAKRLTSSGLVPAIDEIGLPPFNYRVEAIHGLEGDVNISANSLVSSLRTNQPLPRLITAYCIPSLLLAHR